MSNKYKLPLIISALLALTVFLMQITIYMSVVLITTLYKFPFQSETHHIIPMLTASLFVGVGVFIYLAKKQGIYYSSQEDKA